MTLIIGMKCKDGVILVADNKVTNLSNNKEKWISKFEQPLETVPLYYGVAGYVHLFKEFNRKIPFTVNQRIREYELENYARMKKAGVDYYQAVEIKKDIQPEEIQSSSLTEDTKKPKEKKIKSKQLPSPPLVYGHEEFIEDCQLLVKTLCRNEDGTCENKLEVLLILHDGKETRLHTINYANEEQANFAALGSGSIFVNEFLEKFYNDDTEKSFDYCIKLAMFCILYVQKYVKDFSVGVPPNALPENRIILDDGRMGVYKFDKEDEVLKELNSKVAQFITLQDSLQF